MDNLVQEEPPLFELVNATLATTPYSLVEINHNDLYSYSGITSSGIPLCSDQLSLVSISTKDLRSKALRREGM